MTSVPILTAAPSTPPGGGVPYTALLPPVQTPGTSAADSLPFRSATPQPMPNDSRQQTVSNAAFGSDPDRQSGGFFALMQNLMDQLDALIGQLLGSPSTPVPAVPPPTRNLETTQPRSAKDTAVA